MMFMIKIMLSTTNPGKLAEMQAILGALDAHSPAVVQFISPQELGINLDVDENGASYAENARIKAEAFCRASGMPALADDTGLEVDALGGEPGIRSARYAPLDHPTDADRRRHLLSRLQGIPRPWRAHFHCTVALALPSGEIYFTDGDCPGEIIPQERGSHGFGYDPIFLLPEWGRTMAELVIEEKNRISHRARALHAAWGTMVRLAMNQSG